ncbi:MAG TPA: hypothetical protein VEA40_24555 [Ramlibacter sp.]|nr:hypothetical protein [Ramlibacter sp.]
MLMLDSYLFFDGTCAEARRCYCATADEARRVFDASAAGGSVMMRVTKTFWCGGARQAS